MTAARITVAGALALALCGCAAPLPPGPVVAGLELPADWDAAQGVPASSATSLLLWWSRFDDPQLSGLVGQALQANTSVRGAAAALQQALALRDVSAAALLPSLDGSASAQHSLSGRRSAGSSVRAGLDASWELDLFGANQSRLDSSEAAARATAAGLGDVQVSIAAEVALAYITLRGAQVQLAIADDNLASQRELLQITQWRLQAGLVTELEAEQARAGVEQTAAQLPLLRTRIAVSGHALAVLSGQPPAALAKALAAAGPVPQAPGDLAMSLPAETLRQRPDVRAAEHQVSAAVARVAQADAARLPSFRLSGALGLNALTLGTLASGGTAATVLLAGVTLPLFDGGALRAQVRAQQAALEQAQLAYRATVLTALQDVEDALVALQGDRERLRRLQSAADAAANAALMARQRYSSGLVDFQTVLDTQRIQLGTQDGVASAATQLSVDHVRLYKALGGGWQPDAADAAVGMLAP